jgi:hypothetical protein
MMAKLFSFAGGFIVLWLLASASVLSALGVLFFLPLAAAIVAVAAIVSVTSS